MICLTKYSTVDIFTYKTLKMHKMKILNKISLSYWNWNSRPAYDWEIVWNKCSSSCLFACFRDVLKGPQSNGFRFNGMSAVVIDKGYFNPRSFSPVKLNFKTYTPNGLIFLMHGDQDYFSIEMVDGHVLYQYDLGSGAADIRSNGTFNDGQWHTLTATRRNQMGQLLIDDHRKDKSLA